jgi:hypothetical protein
VTVEISARQIPQDAQVPDLASSADIRSLRTFAIAAGLCWSVLFIVGGLGFQLQLYGDGSMFSYSIAVEDAWAFHWHNIPGRLFTYLYATLPAEAYVHLTSDAHGGIVVHGCLFFAAQLFGLIATFAADHSKGRIIAGYACASTACLCPLVFGFPTEMWMAHALFWPTLALCHYAPRGIGGMLAVFIALLALVFTYDGALVFAVAIVATLLARGMWNAAFIRTGAMLLAVALIWIVVREALAPDAYDAVVLARAASHVLDPTIFTTGLALLLFCALASYGIVFAVLRRLKPADGFAYATVLVAAGVAAYWLWFDHALHAENRYYMRTVLLMAVPVLGGLAAAYAHRSDGDLALAIPFVPRLLSVFVSGVVVRAAAGALLLVTLVHAVETAKFVTAWTHYRAAVRALAMGGASDPALGDARFVSSARIGADLNRLSWFSTTPFLSVLLAPNFAPLRLVMDPRTDNYFWLTCEMATASEMADRAIPVDGRRLVRVHACLHR